MNIDKEIIIENFGMFIEIYLCITWNCCLISFNENYLMMLDTFCSGFLLRLNVKYNIYNIYNNRYNIWTGV